MVSLDPLGSIVPMTPGLLEEVAASPSLMTGTTGRMQKASGSGPATAPSRVQGTTSLICKSHTKWCQQPLKTTKMTAIMPLKTTKTTARMTTKIENDLDMQRTLTCRESDCEGRHQHSLRPCEVS